MLTDPNIIFRRLLDLRTDFCKKSGIYTVDRIVCADGFSLSMQAKSTVDCRPRADGAPHYDAFEVGFPSGAEETLMPFVRKGDGEDPTAITYGNVPVNVIEQILVTHGGWATSVQPIHKDSGGNAQE